MLRSAFLCLIICCAILVGCKSPKFVVSTWPVAAPAADQALPPLLQPTHQPTSTQFTIVTFRFSSPVLSHQGTVQPFYASWQPIHFIAVHCAIRKQEASSTVNSRVRSGQK